MFAIGWDYDGRRCIATDEGWKPHDRPVTRLSHLPPGALTYKHYEAAFQKAAELSRRNQRATYIIDILPPRRSPEEMTDDDRASNAAAGLAYRLKAHGKPPDGFIGQVVMAEYSNEEFAQPWNRPGY